MNDAAYSAQMERLFAKDCQVVDFLPKQVPPRYAQKYFAVERYLFERPRLTELYTRFARIAVKLSCYYDLCVNRDLEDDWQENPAPQELVSLVETCPETEPPGSLRILFPAEDAMLALNGDDLYMTLYHPSDALLELVRQMAAAEGLFVRPGAE